MNNDSEILLDVAVLGEQVDQFLKSDIGIFLLEHARIEEEQAILELKRVDCNESKLVQAAQNRLWRAENFKSWLKEAVTAGLKARAILEDREE